jgi:hypothetical protein
MGTTTTVPVGAPIRYDSDLLRLVHSYVEGPAPCVHN